MATQSTLSLDNIQGDIVTGLPKKAEALFFFAINPSSVPAFQLALGDLLPFITTSANCLSQKAKIRAEKARAKHAAEQPKLLELSGINIGFSQKGISALSINDDIGDAPFKAGMLADAPSLNDDLTQWDPEFKKDIHGVVLITGNSSAKVQQTLNDVKGIFGTTITEVLTLNGHTRPGDESGHEHFGFLDGVSNPAITGLSAEELRGQDSINQGIILLGRTGDTITRPTWALDGSLLAFRHLQQLVPEFNAFLSAHALPTPPPAPTGFVTPTGADLLGARLIGRWKSGAPIDLTPTFDQPLLGASPTQNNDFRYDPYKQDRCPFIAHTRKTNPRSDLDTIPNGLEPRRIMRRGIQFGPEVTAAEGAAGKSAVELQRGLLFLAYQSSLSNGFEFIQKNWVNNPLFPPFKDGITPAESGVILPVDPPIPTSGAGVDPIIGQGPARSSRGVLGTNAASPLTPLALGNQWVVSRGGEYFFVPSLKALRETFVGSA